MFFNSNQILKSHHASALLIAHAPPPYNHEESYNLPTPCFLLAISSGSRFFLFCLLFFSSSFSKLIRICFVSDKMGNLLGCGTSLEVDGTAVVETKESSVKEKIKLQKDIVQALDAEIHKHVTLENNAMDAIVSRKCYYCLGFEKKNLQPHFF